jgi:hypothetical protein
VLDPLGVALEHAFHFVDKLVSQDTQLRHRNAHALLGIPAPLGATEINLRVDDKLPTRSALELRLVLKKLDAAAALGALDFEDVLRLPKSLILSRAFNHVESPRIFCHTC